MPPSAYIGEGGSMQSGGDVCGSVGDAVILCVITLVSREPLKVDNSNFVCLGLGALIKRMQK